MLEETSQYNQVRRWILALILSCLTSAFFCFYTFWADTDTGLLLALMSALLSCIIGVRLYLFDIFLLFTSYAHLTGQGHPDKNLGTNLNRFLQASPDLLWRIRYAGREVDSLNNNYADIHPGNDLLNARITTLFPARVARQYLEALIAVQSRGITKCFEYQLPLQDNKMVTFEARVQPFSEEDCIATIRDITALKEAEETLFDQQLFTHQVLDSSPFLVFVRDKFGRFLILNQAAQQTLGHDALVQSHLATIDGSGLFPAGEKDVFEEGHSVRLVDYIIRPTGEKRWFEVTKIPLIREKQVYVLVTAIDITHLKLAEKCLAESEEAWQHVIHHLATPLAIIDSTSFIPLFMNQAMHNMLQHDSISPHNIPLPFIDDTLQHLLHTHKQKSTLRYTDTLPDSYGGGQYAFIFQPILYQTASTFLAVLDTNPEQLTSKTLLNTEPLPKLFH